MSSTTVDQLPLLDNTGDDPTRRAPLVIGHTDFNFVTESVCGVAERKTPKAWYHLDEFPLTPSGKIQKFQILENWEKGLYSG